jgi:hypothetical protein
MTSQHLYFLSIIHIVMGHYRVVALTSSPERDIILPEDVTMQHDDVLNVLTGQ